MFLHNTFDGLGRYSEEQCALEKATSSAILIVSSVATRTRSFTMQSDVRYANYIPVTSQTRTSYAHDRYIWRV